MSNARTRSYEEQHPDEYLEIEEFGENEPFAMVSYARVDKQRVWKLIKKMQPDFRIWCDVGIEEGEEWPEAVAEHIKESGCVIVFLSPSAIQSQVVREEIHYSKFLKKDMVIVYLERCELTPGMQMRLGYLQSIDGCSMSDTALLKKITGAKRLQSCRKPAPADIIRINKQDE